VLLGTGAEASLASVAHGAGRRMGRSEAREKLSARYTRRQAVQGGRVLCDDPALLFEEHPDAYKPIGPVIDALLAHGAARPVATLVPLLTVKR
jgi:release factor H-coupled RctB family protein